QQTDALLASRDYKRGYTQARRASDLVRQAERRHWDNSVSPLSSPVADPMATSLATLPEHWRFVNELLGARQSPNRLPAGDFEDLNAMQRVGWRHFKHPQPGIASEV